MRPIVIAILALIVTPCTALGDDSIGASIGLSSFAVHNRSNTYQVDPNGVCAGFLVPVRPRSLPLYLKVRALYHKADFTPWNGETYDRYIQVSNSLLFVLPVVQAENWSIQGGAGGGIQNESAYSKWGVGVSAAGLFVEASAIVTRTLRGSRLGVMVVYEHGFNSEDVFLVSEDRVQVTLVSFF